MNRRKEEMEKEKLWEIEKEGGDTGRKKGWKRQKRDIYKKKGGGGRPGETEKGRAEETEKERPKETTIKRPRCKTETRLMKIVEILISIWKV